MVKVHLKVVLGDEVMATDRTQEGSLSSVGVEVDVQGSISPQNLRWYYTCASREPPRLWP